MVQAVSSIVWLSFLIVIEIARLIYQCKNRHFMWAFTSVLVFGFSMSSVLVDIYHDRPSMTNCMNHVEDIACRLSFGGIWLYHMFLVLLVLLGPNVMFKDAQIWTRLEVRFDMSTRCACLYYVVLMIKYLVTRIVAITHVVSFLHWFCWFAFYSAPNVNRETLGLYWVWLVFPTYLLLIYKEYNSYKRFGWRHVNVLLMVLHFILFIIAWTRAAYKLSTNISVEWIYFYLFFTWFVQYTVTFYLLDCAGDIELAYIPSALVISNTIMEQFSPNSKAASAAEKRRALSNENDNFDEVALNPMKLHSDVFSIHVDDDVMLSSESVAHGEVKP